MLSLASTLALSTGCSDPVSAPRQAAGRITRDLSYAPAVWAPPHASVGDKQVGLVWKQYHDELWAYDNRPELGFNAHDPSYYRRAASLGGHTLRFDVDYHYQSPGGDAGVFIPRLREARAQGPQVVVVYAPNRGDPNACIGTSDNDYTAYGQAVVALIRSADNNGLPRPEYWQLFNEPDLPVTSAFGAAFGNCGAGTSDVGTQGRNYARMLRIVYPMIRAVDPNAVVVTGGLSYNPAGNPWPFLIGVYTGGGKPFFDVLAVHSYGVDPGYCGPSSSTTRGGQKAGEVFPTVTAWADSGRMTWITEFGLGAYNYQLSCGSPTSKGYSSEAYGYDDYQRRYWRDALSYQQAHPQFSQKVFGFGLDTYEYGASATDLDYTQAIYRGDGVTPRPTATDATIASWNATYASGSSQTTDIEVNAPGKRPVGYQYTVTAGNGYERLHISGIPVNRVPTRITFNSALGANLYYSAFTDGYGWLSEVRDGSQAGTTSEARNVLYATFRVANAPAGVGVTYRTYSQGQGWRPWAANSTVVGNGVPVEALQVQLTGAPSGWRVCYEAHVSAYGWRQGPVCDGQTAGTPGSGYAVQAYDVWLIQTS